VTYPNIEVRSSLEGKAYWDFLNTCHIGINTHDPNVFGDPYKEFDYRYIKRSPSMRVMDYARARLMLLTTRHHRFSSYLYQQVFREGKVVNLTAEALRKRDFLRQVYRRHMHADAGNGAS
jgi:hypothetical protein